MAADASAEPSTLREDPVAAFRELAAVLTEIKAALGADTLSATDVLAEPEPRPEPSPEPEPASEPARPAGSAVPFVVSIVPDAVPTVDEDLVPHWRHRFLGRPVH